MSQKLNVFTGQWKDDLWEGKGTMKYKNDDVHDVFEVMMYDDGGNYDVER